MLIIFLSAFQCEEDEHVPDYTVEQNGLVEIEDNKNTFSVNDYIFLNTKINNQQTATNHNVVKLNDFIVGNDFIHYSLSLYKISSENVEIPFFIEDVLEIECSINYSNESPFFNIACPYKEQDDSFSSKIGLKLLEPADYLIKPDVIVKNKHQIIFDLRGLTSIGDLQLYTSILNADEDGIYRFTVE